ncbi:MAG: endonuclease/exonuclease/phosphatase family protein [Opitutaceae bacterium]
MFRRLLALLLPLTASAAPAPGPVTLRVVCYNIHHGEGLDGRLDLARIAALITAQRADLVALQEVERGTQRTQRRDLPAELARLTGLAVRFARNLPYQGGEYGTAILSRFPLVRVAHTPLTMIGPGEQRGAQQAWVDVQGTEVLFLNTHLDHRRDPAERERSVGEIRALVTAAGSLPVIVAGDFNAVPDSRAIATMREFLTDAWTVAGRGPGFTIPVRQPTRRIDYIWVSRHFTPVRMEVLTSEASDHLPIVAELELRP